MSLAPRVSAASLRDFSYGILCAAGADRQEARVVADCLVWSDLAGLPNQGVWRLPLLLRNLQQGAISSPCGYELRQLSPGCAAIRGKGGFGHYLCRRAMEHAVEIAGRQGVSCVTVNESNFGGALSYYVNLAAERHCVAFMFCNSFPKVAAFGGRRPVLGTNPMAFAAPAADGEHFILDMSTAMSAGSTVTRLREQGGLLPEGIAIDPEGRSIKDPARLGEGALLPFGGAKGFGLALMVEILAGVLASAAISTEIRSLYGNPDKPGLNGHCLIVLDVGAFLDEEVYRERFAMLKSLALCERGLYQTRFHGQRKWQSYRENAAAGIDLDGRTRESLEALAQRFDLETPWTDVAPVSSEPV